MKTSYFSPARPSIHRLPLAIVGCVALALGACEQKSAPPDLAKERQMQDMQAKLDALSAQSAELNKQLAGRDAQDVEAKRQQLEKEQADLDKQRAQLEADRQAVADSTPVAQNVSETTETAPTSDNDDSEPVYQGKPATYDVFYSKLQDDGDWIDSNEYGYIWRPNVSTRERNWRPYSDGRWVETDRGWTWDSNERFGWATYHYGRWVNLNASGWCWVPGNEWAPAWVSWRSSDRYVGWAPLPPEARIAEGGRIDASDDVGYDTGPGFYNFVDTEDFGEDSYVGHIVAEDQNVTIINQTVNVTNITYNDRVINNYGPDYDVIGRRSRRPVGRYQLDLNRSAQFDRDATVPRPRGDRLSVVAPILVASQAGNSDVRPVKVDKKIVKADRTDGWKAVSPAQRQAIKVDLAKKADRQAQNQQAQREEQRAVASRQAARAVREKAAAQPQTQTQPQAQTQAAPTNRANPGSPGNAVKAPAPKPPAVAPNQERQPAAQATQPTQPTQPAQPRQQPKANPPAQVNRPPARADQPIKPDRPDQPVQPNAAQLAAQQAQRQQARAEQEAKTQKAIQANQAAAMQKQNREQAARQQQAQEARQQQAAQQAKQQQQAERQANRSEPAAPREVQQAPRERPQPQPQQSQPEAPKKQEERSKGKAKAAAAEDQTPEDGKQRP